MTYRVSRFRSRERRGDSQHWRRRSPPREFRRQAMSLAGKGLAGGGLSGIVTLVAGSATQHSWPFWPYWVFTGALVAGAVLYYVSQHPAPGRRKLLRRVARPPSLRLAIRVIVGPLGSTPTTADLRDNLLGFLRQSPVSRLLRSLTYTDGDLAWRLYDGDGRRRNEAVLAGREHARKTPAAVAVMTLSEEKVPGDGPGPRTAELMLHIEPRDGHGDPAPPAGFEAWYESLIRALAIPGAFAQFLRHDVDVVTYDDPPVRVAVRFQADRNLSELFDTGGIRPLPGSRPSNSFLDCMTAERVGQAPADAVTDMLIRVCDHGLHLENGYEDALARLRHGR